MKWFNRPKRTVPTPEARPTHRGQNPLFRPPENQSTSAWRSRIISITVGVIGAVVVGLAIYGPWFTITDVSVAGTRQLDQASLERVVTHYLSDWRWLIVPNQSRLLFSRGHLETFLRTEIGKRLSIERVTADADWSGRLTITVAERIPVATWTIDGAAWLVDRSGIIIEHDSGTETAALARLTGAPDSQPEPGAEIVSPEALADAVVAWDELQLAAIDVDVLEFPQIICPEPPPVSTANGNVNSEIITNQSTTSGNANTETNEEEVVTVNAVPAEPLCDQASVNRTRPEIHARLSSNLVIYINRFIDIRAAVQASRRILANPNYRPVEYIDARFGERVFIR